MSNICYYLCCCGCFGFFGQRKYVKKDTSLENKMQSMKTIEEMTRKRKRSKKVSLSPQALNLDEQLTFRVGDKFQTEDEIINSQGYTIMRNEKPLGTGSFAVVFRAIDNKFKTTVAVKVSHYPNDHGLDDVKKKDKKKAMRAIKKELFAFLQIVHPHIIRMYHFFFVAGPTQTNLYLFMQFGAGGDLSTLLKMKGPFDESTCRLWMAQILSAMTYLHTQNIAHRDLKLNNIMLDSHDDILIADFGLSHLVSDGGGLLEAKTYCGTPPYMAPEVFEKRFNRNLMNKAYDPFAVDVWALGVILYVLMTTLYPFEIGKQGKALRKMKSGKKVRFDMSKMRAPPSSLIEDWLTKVFNPNPKKRPKITELTKHEWVKEEYLKVEENCRQWMERNK